MRWKGRHRMDSARFDALTRALAALPARRALRRALFALALGGAAVALPRAERAAKKKCGPCKQKKKGKCKKRKPNNTPCNGTGQCLNGTCNPQPTCEPAFALACVSGDECCSGACIGPFPTSNCGQGAAGAPC